MQFGEAPGSEILVSTGVTTAARLERSLRTFELVPDGGRKFIGNASPTPSLTTIECGRWEESSHGDAMHKIILVLDGQIDVEGDSGGWLVIPNHMIFVPADRPFNLRTSQGTRAHVAFLSPEDYPWHYHGCWVTQANPLAHEYLALMLNLSARECPDVDSLRQMFRTLSHMCHEWFSNPKMLWIPAARSEQMRAFVRYVSEDLAGATVSAACEACHMAQRTMQRMSHDEFSFGLKTLLTEIRMMRAMELLVEDRLSVEAVAMSIGYSRLSSFTTAFTKRTGLSPSEFRQKNLFSLRACRAAAAG